MLVRYRDEGGPSVEPGYLALIIDIIDFYILLSIPVQKKNKLADISNDYQSSFSNLTSDMEKTD